MVRLGFIGLALAGLVACQSTGASDREVEPQQEIAELAEGEQGIAMFCARVITVDDENRMISPGLIVTRGGLIEYVGSPIEVPDGYERRNFGELWAVPGMVDLHTHVHTGNWGDINSSINLINPELKAGVTMVPANPLLQRAAASGVTTLFGIPGSATSMGGFGILYKATTSGGYEDSMIADPGGLKVAQSHNPDRNANAVMRSWAGLGWLLEEANDRAIAALEQDRFDPQLENLKRVHSGELPVLIHCAGGEGVANTVRMWRINYPTRSILSHGSFDGWKLADFVAANDMPVNHGPRTMDYYSSRTGRVEPSALAYWESGGPNFSLNTDSQIIPQHEFFLQGAMSARQGAPSYQMLRALTINPARAFGYGDRLGSIEVGKDADIVIWTGDPLDPRSHVEFVLIDGKTQYDKQVDGQWS
ncbi:MAG: imidazolonepropionase-like amidohydrolase [Hyphomicrobiaceae bacterium]